MRDHPITTLPRTLLSLCLLLCSLAASASATATHFQLSRPLATDALIPTCSLSLFEVSVAASVTATTFSGTFTPPENCSAPWSAAVLEIFAASAVQQPARVASVWVAGVEILRTSTVSANGSAVWTVRKDVSRYVSVFSQLNSTSPAVLTLENVRKASNFTGDVAVNVSLSLYHGVIHLPSLASSNRGIAEENPNPSIELGLEIDEILEFGLDSQSEEGFYVGEISETTEIEIQDESDDSLRNLGSVLRLPSQDLKFSSFQSSKFDDLSKAPADLIIPVSHDAQTNGSGAGWFRISKGSDSVSKEVLIPNNTFKAVLEVCVSSQGEEELWYAKPPSPSLVENNLTLERLNGTFRMVYAAIDGRYVGSAVPFPVVYTGSIHPKFWHPIVPIAAFDLPTYEFDLTPILGLLLDGKRHRLMLGVSEAASFWLLGANLHLWLDPNSTQTTAEVVKYTFPPLSFTRKFKFGTNQKEFKVEASRETQFVGWVNSSLGNITTSIRRKFEFKNDIEINTAKLRKEIDQTIKEEIEVAFEESGSLLSRTVSNAACPLEWETTSRTGKNGQRSTETEFNQGYTKNTILHLPSGNFTTNLTNKQECEAKDRAKDQLLLSSEAIMKQNYHYTSANKCYTRSVEARHGRLSEDSLSNICRR